VTFGLAATGKFPWSEVPSYLAAQVLGAVAGALRDRRRAGKQASDIGLGVAAYGDSIPGTRPSSPSSSAPSCWSSRSSA
jgi:glycerol uptake facilitator protein